MTPKGQRIPSASRCSGAALLILLGLGKSEETKNRTLHDVRSIARAASAAGRLRSDAVTGNVGTRVEMSGQLDCRTAQECHRNPVLSPQGPAAAAGSLRRRAKEVYSARVGGSKSEIPG